MHLLKTFLIEFDKDCFGTDEGWRHLSSSKFDDNLTQLALKLSDIHDFTSKERILSYVMGDFNIDLLKCDEHALTMEHLNTLYADSYLLIAWPIRVMQTKLATLIDNIYTTNV